MTNSVEYKEVPITEDQCPVLESFLEFAGHDLAVPEMTELPQLDVRLMHTIARCRAAVQLAFTRFLVWEASQSGLEGFADRLREFSSIATPQDAERLAVLYNEQTARMIAPELRRFRVVTMQFSSLLNLNHQLSATMTGPHHPDMIGHISMCTTTIASIFSALASRGPQDLRQEVLERLLAVRVIVKKREETTEQPPAPADGAASL